MQWEHYLTRSFNLFGASFWHEWYVSPLPKEIIGANMPDAIFVEQKKDVVRCYREAAQVQKFTRNISSVAEKQPKRLEQLLRLGLYLNSVALKKLQKTNQAGSLTENISFAIKHALYASTIPYIAGKYVDKNTKNFTLINSLRRVSYYPHLLQQIIVPLAMNKLELKGIQDASKVYSRLTVREILHDSRKNLMRKLKRRPQNQKFIYWSRNGRERITYEHSTAEYIRSLEKLPKRPPGILHGQIAFPGIVRGVARVIFHNDSRGVPFKVGDILISINSNPSLLPLLKKCAAIVTDEGGVTCHAAIISRELKKPCIIGTKVSTSVIHDGDYIEVDAKKGVVKRITKIRHVA